MFHLFRFVAGVVTGMVAMSLIKSKKGQAGLERAEDKLRDATEATMDAVKSASARARARFAGDEPEAGGGAGDVPKSSRRGTRKSAASPSE